MQWWGRVTYPDASVHAPRHQVDVVELEAGDGTGMADQTAVDLSTAEIPESDHTIGGTARQSSVKALECPDEIR